MERNVKLIVVLCLVLYACDFSQMVAPLPQPTPTPLYEPTELLDSWTAYQYTLELGGVEIIYPAELMERPLVFTLYKGNVATLSTLDREQELTTIHTYSWYDMTEESFGATVADASATYNCSYRLIDDDHLELRVVEVATNVGSGYYDGEVAQAESYLLMRGVHPMLTFAEGATSEQLAEREVPEPSSGDPVRGSAWRFESVSMVFRSGLEERVSAEVAGVEIELSFDNEGVAWVSIADEEGFSDSASFGYTYNPGEGEITFEPNDFFVEGPFRVVRREERLRLLLKESDEEMVVYRFSRVE